MQINMADIASTSANQVNSESDEHDILNTARLASDLPDNDAKITPAARAQLSRDTKVVERLRLLGQNVPDDLLYVDESIDERRLCAQQKVAGRRKRKSGNDNESPVRQICPRNANSAPAAVSIVSEADNENTQRTTKRAQRPCRIVPLVAAGVHLRQLRQVRAQYATPVSGNAADSKGE